MFINAITSDTQLPGWIFHAKLIGKPNQLIKRRGQGVDHSACRQALSLNIPVGALFPSRETIASTLLPHVPDAKKDALVDFVIYLYSVYVDLHFAYLEINPITVPDVENGGEPTIYYLDMSVKIDQNVESIYGPKLSIAHGFSV